MSTLLMLLGTLFAFGALYNLTTPRADLANAILGLSIAFACGGSGWLMRRHNTDRRAFALWLASNRSAIEQGTADYNGRRVNRATEVASFTMVFSFLIVTLTSKTRYYFTDYGTGGAAAAPTIVTLLLGWWGLPWGIIRTIQALSRNISGGEIVTVGDLLDQMPAVQGA